MDYWYEPTASGKPRLWLQDAWDTCRRLPLWAQKERGHSVAARPVSGHSTAPEWIETPDRSIECYEMLIDRVTNYNYVPF